MRILAIEDDIEIANFLQESLQREGFIVDIARDGDRGSFLSRTNEYDFIILDYILPEKDGLAVCKEIRQQRKDVPILMLSVRSSIPDKVKLLNLGVDDYLAKPFSLSELLARIRAILRRPKKLEGNPITYANLELERMGQRLFKEDEEIYLTRKEFLLLEYFMKNIGIVLSRGMLLEHVWNVETDPFSNTIEAHILNLRRKIDPNHLLIHTIPGRGYKMELKEKSVKRKIKMKE